MPTYTPTTSLTGVDTGVGSLSGLDVGKYGNVLNNTSLSTATGGELKGPAPTLAPPVQTPQGAPIVSTSAPAQTDVNNKMGVMTAAGPAQTPNQLAQPLLGVEQKNTATANSTAYGATTQTGPLIYDPNLPKGFAKDMTGRIFKVPEGTTVQGAPGSTSGTTTGGTTTGGTTTGGTTETGGTTTDAGADAAKAAADAATKANQDQADAHDTQVMNDIDAIRNGTFALTSDQQQQITNIQNNFASLIEAQKIANQNYQNAVAISGFRTGIAEGAQQINQGNIAAAVSAGTQAIAKINNEMSDAISKAKEGFATNNLKLIEASYAVYSDAVKRRQDVIDKTYDRTMAAIKEAREAAAQKTQDALTMAQIKELENKPLNQQTQAVQGAIADLIVKYPDAGIEITDTPAQIAEKVKASQSFKNEQAKKTSSGGATWRATDTYTDVNGNKHTVYTNLATGARSESIPQGDTVMSDSSGGGWSTQSGMRTDRNNNPIAVSNAAPEFMNVLDAAGIKYTTEEGADFGGGLKTLKFATPQDGIEASRALLAGSPMAFSWYSNHTGKAVLDQYGIKSNADFAKADKATQDAVIKGIYQAEGGNGSLVGETVQPAKGGATYAKLDSVGKQDAEALASYDVDLAKIPANRRAGIIAAAQELNPNWSQSDYDNRRKFKINWSSGTTSQNINAINTFANHVGELSSVMTAAANSKTPAYNAVKGWVAKESGNPGLTAANASIDAVASEFAKILKGGGAAPTEGEISEARKFLSSTQSPQQTSAVLSTLANLVGGRTNALRDQWREAMGSEAQPVLRDSARKALRDAGLDPDALENSVRTPATDEQAQAAPVGTILYYGGHWLIKKGDNDYDFY